MDDTTLTAMEEATRLARAALESAQTEAAKESAQAAYRALCEALVWSYVAQVDEQVAGGASPKESFEKVSKRVQDSPLADSCQALCYSQYQLCVLGGTPESTCRDRLNACLNNC